MVIENGLKQKELLVKVSSICICIYVYVYMNKIGSGRKTLTKGKDLRVTEMNDNTRC